jgi:hypothetical protein
MPEHGAPQAGDVPVGLADLPGLLGVAVQTPRRWRERGVLPEPEDHIGGSPWWWQSRIVAWHDQRRTDQQRPV